MSYAEIESFIMACCLVVIAVMSVAIFIAIMMTGVHVHDRLCDIRDILKANHECDTQRESRSDEPL